MTKTIVLNGKRGAGKVALVDDADYDRIIKYKWNVDRKGYARAHFKAGDGIPRHVKLHRFVMDAKPGQLIDHVNRDRLDCRRQNLRFCSHSENQSNRPRARRKNKYRGVDESKYATYRAAIRVGNVHIHIGTYPTPEEAALAYDAAALQLHGEFAILNSEVR